MILIWLLLFVEILLYFIIKPYINNPDVYATILIFIHIPVFIIAIRRTFLKELFLYVFIGFFLRLIIMYWDIYASEIISLPHSGGDSVGFYNAAFRVSQDLSLIAEDIYGGLYTKSMGVVLYLGPSSPIVLQYINILLGISSIIIVYKIMNQLNINYRLKKLMIILMVIFPSSLIFSSILLRESIISYLIILSFYFFAQWLFNGKKINVFISLSILLLASLFHSGVISLLVGYIFMLLFYNPKIRRFQSSIQTVFIFSMVIIVFIFLNSTPIEKIPFLYKFEALGEDENAIYNIANTSRGGSVYLQNLQITNPIQMILFAPIKILYFLISPVPLDWRGISDVGTFLYDGIIYGVLFLYPIVNYKKMKKLDPITITLFIMLLSATFVFGISLNNSGTAMRHRYKLFYLLIVIFSLSVKNKTDFNKKTK